MSHELAKAELRSIIEIKRTQARELKASRAGNNDEQRCNLQRADAVHAQITQIEAALAVLEEDRHV